MAAVLERGSTRRAVAADPVAGVTFDKDFAPRSSLPRVRPGARRRIAPTACGPRSVNAGKDYLGIRIVSGVAEHCDHFGEREFFWCREKSRHERSQPTDLIPTASGGEQFDLRAAPWFRPRLGELIDMAGERRSGSVRSMFCVPRPATRDVAKLCPTRQVTCEKGAIILCGGQVERMGSDKAKRAFGSELMSERGDAERSRSH